MTQNIKQPESINYIAEGLAGRRKVEFLQIVKQRAELLEALKAAQKKGSRWHPTDPVVLQIKEAINRAEATE